jgi:hypothetical protein
VRSRLQGPAIGEAIVSFLSILNFGKGGKTAFTTVFITGRVEENGLQAAWLLEFVMFLEGLLTNQQGLSK